MHAKEEKLLPLIFVSVTWWMEPYIFVLAQYYRNVGLFQHQTFGENKTFLLVIIQEIKFAPKSLDGYKLLKL